MWWDESDDVVFDVERRVSRSRAALETAQSADAESKTKSTKGMYYIPVPRPFLGDGKMPTFKDWAEEQSKKSGAKTRRKTKWG